MYNVRRKRPLLLMLFRTAVFINTFSLCRCGDISAAAFSGISDGSVPAAFGDFNSDELTDLFVINRRRTLLILLGNPVEPYFRQAAELNCTLNAGNIINSVIPGDFDGDALTDVIVTGTNKTGDTSLTQVYVFWGGLNNLTCSNEPIIEMLDEPLAIDRDGDMIIDLFGINVRGERGYWIFEETKRSCRFERALNYTLKSLRIPHSHAFFDMNNDNAPDLYLTAEDGFEIHLWNDELKNFVWDRLIPFPQDINAKQLGQTLFMDAEIAGKTDHVLPACLGTDPNDPCSKSVIFVYSRDKWHTIVEFGNEWSFAKSNRYYLETVTLRAGDYNMDGYPDILVTLRRNNNNEDFKSMLLINKERDDDSSDNNNNNNNNRNDVIINDKNIDFFNRTFSIVPDAFQTANDRTVMGVFYDFQQDGVIDVIFVRDNNNNNEFNSNASPYNMSAYKNSIDYDANFIKVMVITGLINSNNSRNFEEQTLFGTKRHTFGTNLPGPKVSYKTTTQEGVPRTGVSNQLPQSAHLAMYLPYTIFGLGRTPNFVEDLTVGAFNACHTWTQIIPNSQLIVIPYPANSPSKWKAQLFVTPSKIILQSVLALSGICSIILLIIGLLHLKEKREDRIERLQEAHRFHFDAM